MIWTDSTKHHVLALSYYSGRLHILKDKSTLLSFVWCSMFDVHYYYLVMIKQWPSKLSTYLTSQRNKDRIGTGKGRRKDLFLISARHKMIGYDWDLTLEIEKLTRTFSSKQKIDITKTKSSVFRSSGRSSKYLSHFEHFFILRNLVHIFIGFRSII